MLVTYNQKQYTRILYRIELDSQLLRAVLLSFQNWRTIDHNQEPGLSIDRGYVWWGGFSLASLELDCQDSRCILSNKGLIVVLYEGSRGVCGSVASFLYRTENWFAQPP